MDSFRGLSREKLCDKLSENVKNANIPSMIMTMGANGAVYASMDGEKGYCPAEKVIVRDTTGAGDAFCAGCLVGIFNGLPEAEILSLGGIAAVGAMSAPGAVEGMRPIAELKKLISEF